MAIVTDLDGNQIDTSNNWQVVKKGTPPPIVDGRTPEGTLPRETKQDVPFEGPMDAVSGLVKNLSWSFNSALFALPDLAYKEFAKANGLKGEEITQLSKIFNRGETAPKNSYERYARAIGEGAIMALPFSGVLARVAFARPISTGLMLAPEAGIKGIFKGLAKDTLDYIAANPTKAIATDLAFGSAYETLKQAVEEQVSDSNPNKEMYKEVLPAAAFIGPAAWYMVSPARNAASWVKNKLSGVSVSKAEGAGAAEGLDAARQDAMAGLPDGYKLPIIKIFPNYMMGRAEQKLGTMFKSIADSPEAQQSLKELAEWYKNPTVSQYFTVDGKPTFNFAEQTMSPALGREQLNIFEQMTPAQLGSNKQHILRNQEAYGNLVNAFAPESRQPISEAFKAAQANRQQLFESLLTQQKDLTQAEIASISQRLGPQDMNRLNDEVRGVMASSMELDYKMRNTILGRYGFNVGYSPEGVALATRENGASLFPAQDMEDAAISLIAKYKIDRPSLAQNVPEPIRLLDRFVKNQKLAREKLEEEALDSVTKQYMYEKYPGLQDAPEDVKNEVFKAINNVLNPPKKEAKQLGFESFKKIDTQGNVTVPIQLATGRKDITFNPVQLKADAALIAKENTKIDINLPEALDYLVSAQKFRNSSLFNYNDALRGGRMRYADASRIIKTGEAVHNDIEKLILDHVPKIGKNYENMRGLLQDYRAGYEQKLPLLITQKVRGGEKYFLPNEQVMSKAFENAENLKQLQLTLNNAPELDDFLQRGTIDWLRKKGVVNDKGLVDPKKIRSVLDKNLNIVNALPAKIQAGLKNEVQLAEDYVARLGQIDSRRVLMEDKELSPLLAKASRTDADPSPILEKALGDPAVMRTLVNEFGKDPEKLAALRRSVYDLAMGGAKKGGALQGFIENNEKSLKILLGDTVHYENMKILAGLQRRVNAFADVTGQIPLFEASDEKLKRLFGFGIKFATVRALEVSAGRASPETSALALMLRLAGSVEQSLYKRLFTRAMEDPSFAQSITHINTPKEAASVAKGLQEIGIDISKVYQMPRAAAPHPAALTAKQMLLSENQPQPEQRPQPTSQQMLRALPPAPPSRGLPVSGMAIPAAKPYAPPQAKSMYAAMFPNDPISGLIQQKMAQQPTQPPQGVAQ